MPAPRRRSRQQRSHETLLRLRKPLILMRTVTGSQKRVPPEKSRDVCSLCSCHRSEAAQHFANARGHDMSLWSTGWEELHHRQCEAEGGTPMGTTSPLCSMLQLSSKGFKALDAFVKDVPSDWVSSLPRSRLLNDS